MQTARFPVMLLWLLGTASPAADPAWDRVALSEAVGERALHGVFFLNDRQGWIVGERGLCLSTTDGGNTWVVVETGSGATLREVHFTDAKTGLICGDGDSNAPKTGGHVLLGKPLKAGSLLATTNGGKRWDGHWLPINFEITGVEPAAAPVLQVGVSGGDGHPDGDILRSPDGGKTWNGTRCYRSLFDVRVLRDKSWAAVGSAVSVGVFRRRRASCTRTRAAGPCIAGTAARRGACRRAATARYVCAPWPFRRTGRSWRWATAARCCAGRRWRLVGGGDQLDYGGSALGRLRRQIGRRGR